MSDYDLTQLDRPLGEYPDEVIGALVRAYQMGAKAQCYSRTAHTWVDAAYLRFFLVSTYRLAPEPRRHMTPPWEVLPEWVQSVVREGDGRVFGLETRDPSAKYGKWYGTGRTVNLTDFRFDRGNMPWDQSLVLRPEDV